MRVALDGAGDRDVRADRIEVLAEVTGDRDTRAREPGIAADAGFPPKTDVASSGREIAAELCRHRDVAAGKSGGALRFAAQLDGTAGGDHAVRDVAINQHAAARDHGITVDRAAQLDG